MDLAAWMSVTDSINTCNAQGMPFQQNPQQNFDMNSNPCPNMYGMPGIGIAMNMNQACNTMGMYKGAGHPSTEDKNFQNNGQWEGIYNIGGTMGSGILQSNMEVSTECPQQQHQMHFDQQTHAQQVYAHQLYAQQVYQQQIQQQQQLQMNTPTQFPTASAAEPEQQYKDYFAPAVKIAFDGNVNAHDGTQKSGMVNRWFKEKKSGWIRGDDGTNLFVHYSDVHGKRQELQTGERVTYFVGWNHKVSKEKAEKVKPLVENPSPPVQITMMPLEGTVLRWHDDKSFGFIKYDNGSVFVHHTDLIDAERLQAGQKVKFEIIVNAACNKHKAVRVSVINDNFEENGGWDNLCENNNNCENQDAANDGWDHVASKNDEYENNGCGNDDWNDVACNNDGNENDGDGVNACDENNGFNDGNDANACDENDGFEQLVEPKGEPPQEEASLDLVVKDLSNMAVNESTT